MATNTNYNRLVEDYLNGDMSTSEKDIFESQLSSDPMLQSELNHQSEIIEGLESFRKAELKSRLAAINVNPTILGVISQTAAIKSAVTVATVAVVATGAYYFGSNRAEFQLQQVEPIYEYVLNETELPNVVEKLEQVEIKESTTLTSPGIKSNKTNANSVVAQKTSSQPVDFQVPTAPDASDSEILVTSEGGLENNSNNMEGLADVVKLDKVEVENIVDKKYSFHYRYSSGKLYLYGKFEKSPYEIIEVNTKREKRIFFLYQGSYYRIEKSASEITAFEIISDKNLINELNILKVKQ